MKQVDITPNFLHVLQVRLLGSMIPDDSGVSLSFQLHNKEAHCKHCSYMQLCLKPDVAQIWA